MRQRILVLGLVLAASVSVRAWGGYVTFEQITVAGSSIGFTASKISGGNGHEQAVFAHCRLETAEIRYTVDGATTPTSTVGEPLEPGDILEITGNDLLQRFRAIRTGSSGQLNCTYTGQ